MFKFIWGPEKNKTIFFWGPCFGGPKIFKNKSFFSFFRAPVFLGALGARLVRLGLNWTEFLSILLAVVNVYSMFIVQPLGDLFWNNLMHKI